MTKKILRVITDKTEQKIKDFNKTSDIQGKNRGITVKRLNLEQKKAYEEAIKKGDIENGLNTLDAILPEELYLNLPDISISENGSIKSLSVIAYSSQTREEVLLHKLFSKLREPKS